MAEKVEDVISKGIELYVPLEQVLGFLQLTDVGVEEVSRKAEVYVSDKLISKSEYMLLRDRMLRDYGVEGSSPVMLYDDYLVKYSANLRVFDKKVALLKDFVNLNLGYFTGVMVEPFTKDLWVTPKFYDVFHDYLKTVEDAKQKPYKVLEERFGLPEVKLYTLSVLMELMYGNEDGMKSMTPLQYATLVAFLTNYTLVEDKVLLGRLKESKLPNHKFKGVGVFVENAVYRYLSNKGRDEVVRDKVLVEIDGQGYYDEVDTLRYLLDDSKLPRMSVLNAIHRGLLQGKSLDNKVLYKVEELQALVGYYNKGYNLSLAVIFSRGLIDEETFKEQYINKYQLRKVMVELRDNGYISNAFMTYYINKDVDSLTNLYGVPVYKKEQVLHDLWLHRVLSPIGSAYSEGYYNILLVLKYLEMDKVEETESWRRLGFMKEDGSWVYDNTLTSLGVMATPNMCVISKDYLDDVAISKIEKFRDKQMEDIKKVFLGYLENISLLD